MRLSRELIRRFRALEVANVSDANRNLALGKVKSLSPHLVARHRRDCQTRMIGQALTAACDGDDFHVMVRALASKPPPNTVLCVKTDGDGGCGGDLFTSECRRLEFGGLVVDGNVRDVANIRNLDFLKDFPVYSHGTNPVAGTNKAKGKLGEPLRVGPTHLRTEIRNGDIIFGDDDGAIVISMQCEAEVETLLEEAEQIHESEREILSRVAGGEPLLDCF